MTTWQQKPVEEQVIVITGGTSGIGLTTARMAVERGARVVITGRDTERLEAAARQISSDPQRVLTVPCDVGDPDQVDAVAQAAIERFGGFDTWVNNAGTSIYGRLWEVDLADKRRLFDTNFWGMVHGTRSALRHLRNRGGTIINLGSVVSDRSLPLQGIYSATKHAVKAYTDALRMEIDDVELPVQVTLIKPTAIDTPFFEHAKNYMDEEPAPPPPVYAPETVARAILHAAEHPVRDVMVGGAAKALSVFGTYAPTLADKAFNAFGFEAQKSGRPASRRTDSSLYESPHDTPRERGRYEGRVNETSLYTAAALRPMTSALVAVGVGAAVFAGWRAIEAARTRRAENGSVFGGRGRQQRGPYPRAHYVNPQANQAMGELFEDEVESGAVRGPTGPDDEVAAGMARSPQTASAAIQPS